MYNLKNLEEINLIPLQINKIAGVCSGINEENWKILFVDGVVHDSHELFRLTYYGGISHHLRKQVSMQSN